MFRTGQPQQDEWVVKGPEQVLSKQPGTDEFKATSTCANGHLLACGTAKWNVAPLIIETNQASTIHDHSQKERRCHSDAQNPEATSLPDFFLS